MLRQLGTFVTRRPRAVVATWALALLVAAGFASGLSDQLANRGFAVPGSPSERAELLTRAHFPRAGGSTLVAAAAATAPRPRGLRLALAEARGALGRQPHVVGVGAIAIGRDRRVGLLPFTVDLFLAKAQEEVPALAAAAAAADRPGIELQVLGEAAVYKRYSDIAAEDLQRSEAVVFPLILAILLVAFLSVVAALLPAVSGAVCLAVVFGAIYLVSLAMEMSIFVVNVASILGIGLSIDFALFSVTRFRELMSGPDGLDPAEAAAEAVATTGRAIALSGLTVAASLALLLLVQVGIFSSIAVGAMLAALIAAAVGLTLVPAMLTLLGPHVDRLRLRRSGDRGRRDRLWREIATWTTAHPFASVIGGGAVLVALALPLGGLTIVSGPTSELPADDPLRRSIESVDESFGPATTAPVELVASRESAPRAAAMLRADPGIRRVATIVTGDDWTRIEALLATTPDSPAARRTVRRVQGLADRENLMAYVGGQTAELGDLVDRIEARSPYVVLGALLLGATILALGLGSIVIAIKAVITTALSTAAGVGAVNLLFTGIGGDAGLGYFVPLVVFTIVFGLSIDYETFLMSRIREEVRGGRSNRGAIVEGVARTGRSITLAGVVMLVVFSAFAAGRLAPFQELGLGLTIAVALDVTVVRLALVPGTLALLGRWNWWTPRWPGQVASRSESAR